MSRSGRKSTATSNFGVGRREGHDASAFYARFAAPEISEDDSVLDPMWVSGRIGDPFKPADARSMDAVPDGSVALVVTSPPYFAGKSYEEELERDGIPASYEEYLKLLADVFAECKRKLEPGGRIAVNVANLGRRPYRSLSADVIGILQDRLGLLLRGEIIWRKGEGAGGSCAWGSYLQPTNPSIRDLTERIIVASKGRFDRARSRQQRQGASLPHRSTLPADAFMENTLDVWNIPPASAKRTGHPAPFPVELPERLIHTYTWVDDLVLDPFMGSGSALVAAVRSGRRYVGYDLDPAYVDLARRRVGEAVAAVVAARDSDETAAVVAPEKGAKALAEQLLSDAGFEGLKAQAQVRGLGVKVDFSASDRVGGQWFVDLAGATFAHARGGLRRVDPVLRSIGRAHAIRSVERHAGARVLVLTSHLPEPRSSGERALRAAGPHSIFDVVGLRDHDVLDRLKQYAAGGFVRSPEVATPRAALPGFWPASM